MADYDVTIWTSSVAPLGVVGTEIKAVVDTIDTAKTLRTITVIPVGNNAQAIIVYDT